MNDEAANAFLKTLEEPPPGAVLILIGTSPELQLETIVSRCQITRFEPLPEPLLADLLLERGVAGDADDAARLAALGEGSVSRATGLADPELEQFRRELIDEIAAEHGFDPSELAGRLGSFVKLAGKETVDQRRRAGLLVGELARLFRGVLWQTAGLSAPCPDPADRRAAQALAERLEPEDVFVLADRCFEATYHLQRNLYMPVGPRIAVPRPGPADRAQGPGMRVAGKVGREMITSLGASCPASGGFGHTIYWGLRVDHSQVNRESRESGSR